MADPERFDTDPDPTFELIKIPGIFIQRLKGTVFLSGSFNFNLSLVLVLYVECRPKMMLNSKFQVLSQFLIFINIFLIFKVMIWIWIRIRIHEKNSDPDPAK